MTNIGLRPSDDDIPIPTVETFLLNFDQDIYGRQVILEVFVYIRGVKKFAGGLAEVRKQIDKDIEQVHTYMDEVYLRALEAKIVGIVHYLKTNPTYSPWKDCWDRMEKNIRKNGFNFQRLDESDQDIAFVIDKGVKKSFRIRGEDRRYIPLNIEQYVLYHEMAHLANDEFGHGAKFCMLLSIICLAGYECGYIDLKRISKTVYMTNSQPILCQADMKREISDGIGHIIKKNPNKEEHYRKFLRGVGLASKEMDSPIYNLVHNLLLFTSSSSQIDASSFNTFMSHKIGKQRYIIETLKKIFSKTVTERMKINYLLIHSVFF